MDGVDATPEGSETVMSFMARMDVWFWHPSGVRDFWRMVPGVSLALNPRLPSGTALPCRLTSRCEAGGSEQFAPTAWEKSKGMVSRQPDRAIVSLT